MKESGRTIRRKALDYKHSPMDAALEDTTLTTNHRGLAVTIGLTDNTTMESGLRGLSMARECGEELKETLTRESGNLGNLMVLGFTLG